MRGPYTSAPRFDYDQAVVHTLSRLRLLDTAAPGPGRPLLAGDPSGVVMGAFSPSGARLAVYRIEDGSWRLGIVTLATGAVRWLPVTPQGDGRGRNLQWRDDRTLLVLHRPDGRGPLALRQGSTLARELPRRWAAAADGTGAHTAYGSGAYLGVRDRGADNRLLQVDVETSAATVLAQGQFTDLELSPRGDRVALFEAGRDLQAQGERPVRGPAGSETEATTLSLLDLRTGLRVTPCAACDLSPQLLSWSPSGRRLLVFARGADGLWPDGHLIVVDAERGALEVAGSRVQPHLDLNPATVWTAWLGETPLVYGRDRGAAADRDDWFALSASAHRNLTGALPAPSRSARIGGAGAFHVWAGATLWRLSPQGPTRAVATGSGPAVWRDLRFGAGSRLARAAPPRLWIGGADGSAETALRGVASDGGATTVGGAASAGDWIDAAASGVGLQRGADAHGVETLMLTVGGRTTVVATANAGWAELEAPRVVPVRHLSPSGARLVSWVFLPAGGTDGPLPLLVRAYPGATFPQPPQEAPGRVEFYQNVRVLTSHGYAVLVPSLPNPKGGMTEPAEGMARTLLDIVQAALDTPQLAGRLDPDRMAVVGHSFGGYAAMTTITQTDCFRAAVSMNGLSDLTSYWSSIPAHLQLNSELAYWSNWHTGVVERTQPELQAPPWRDPARYVRNSPLFAADRIRTPLLLIHGGQDGLSLAQSEAMYSALFRQGKDALLLVYWGAMHMPAAPGDVRDIYARTFRFLDEHLGPVSTGAGRSASPAPASASAAPRPRSPPPTGCPRASPPR